VALPRVTRVLLLGGTGEAHDLAGALTRVPGLEVTSSLAGRTAEPRLPPGRVRIGGFGDVAGLLDHLRTERIDAVVDATHPFAERITAHAARACRSADVPLLILRREGWTAGDGDRWHRVATVAEAAREVAARPDGAVLVTVGRRDLAAFAADLAHHYVIRSIEAPDGALPARHTVVAARGPFTLDDERALLRDHAVTVLVTKDSGGPATAAKLVAAREAGVPVVMVDRPALPDGVPVVAGLEDAVRWVADAADA
jgi:precorrin-6A/cobalt-precorrin-6A reductase